MMTDNILTAIDVGTTKICTMIGRKSAQSGLEFLAHSVVPCDGLKKGNVTDVAGTAHAIRRSIDEASSRAQVTVKSAYVGVTGAHVSFENRWDKMIWAGEGGVVTATELARVPDGTQPDASESDRRVIHALPVSYAVDGLTGIRNPVGMHTKDVDVESHVVTGTASVLDKLLEAVEMADIDVDALVLEPLASSEAVLTRDEKKHGAIVVDIGGGTTDVVAYAGGRIFFTAVLPVGGFQFTNDICVTYNTPYPAAEEVKIRYAHTDLHAVRATEEVAFPVIGRSSDLKVPRRDICQLSRERAQELARLVKLKLQEIPTRGLSDMTLVLTGGTSSLPGLDHLFRSTLGTKVRIGIPHGHGLIPDDLRAPAFATGVGILLWADGHPKAVLSDQSAIRSQTVSRNGGLVSRFLKQIKNAFPTHLFPVRNS